MGGIRRARLISATVGARRSGRDQKIHNERYGSPFSASAAWVAALADRATRSRADRVPFAQRKNPESRTVNLDGADARELRKPNSGLTLVRAQDQYSAPPARGDDASLTTIQAPGRVTKADSIDAVRHQRRKIVMRSSPHAHQRIARRIRQLRTG